MHTFKRCRSAVMLLLALHSHAVQCRESKVDIKGNFRIFQNEYCITVIRLLSTFL